MEIIFEPFGYFVSLKLIGFVYNDKTNEWSALTEFKETTLEHKLMFKLNQKKNSKKKGVIIYLKDTPYGDVSYMDFDTKTNMTHAQFLPNELKADMSNSFGSSNEPI